MSVVRRQRCPRGIRFDIWRVSYLFSTPSTVISQSKQMKENLRKHCCHWRNIDLHTNNIQVLKWTRLNRERSNRLESHRLYLQCFAVQWPVNYHTIFTSLWRGSVAAKIRHNLNLGRIYHEKETFRYARAIFQLSDLRPFCIYVPYLFIPAKRRYNTANAGEPQWICVHYIISYLSSLV